MRGEGSVGGLIHEGDLCLVLEEIRVTAFVDQSEKIEGVIFALVIDVMGKRLRGTTRKSVWSNVVTASGLDDRLCLLGYPDRKRFCQFNGNVFVFRFFPIEVSLKECTKNDPQEPKT